MVYQGPGRLTKLQSYHIDDDLPQDLSDLKFVTGESKSKLVSKAIRSLLKERTRWMEPTSIAAERLLSRYGRNKE